MPRVARGLPDGMDDPDLARAIAAADHPHLSARVIADQFGHAKPSMTTDVYMGRNVVSAAAAQLLDR